MLIMGIIFAAVGGGVLGGSRYAERNYYDSLTERTDMKEFIQSNPESSGYGAVRIGGIISLVVGGVLLVIAAGIRFWGWGG
jgi:hypothetical protein